MWQTVDTEFQVTFVSGPCSRGTSTICIYCPKSGKRDGETSMTLPAGHCFPSSGLCRHPSPASTAGNAVRNCPQPRRKNSLTPYLLPGVRPQGRRYGMGGQPSRATLASGSEVWRDGIAIPVSGACPVNASLLVNVTHASPPGASSATVLLWVLYGCHS